MATLSRTAICRQQKLVFETQPVGMLQPINFVLQVVHPATIQTSANKFSG